MDLRAALVQKRVPGGMHSLSPHRLCNLREKAEFSSAKKDFGNRYLKQTIPYNTSNIHHAVDGQSHTAGAVQQRQCQSRGEENADVRKLHRKRSLIMVGWISIAVIIMAASASAQWGDYWQQLPLAEDWDPVAKSQAVASQLLQAQRPDEVEAILYDVLERIGLGVYTAEGEVIVVGNESDADDFYLYDFEVALLARAFLNEQYVALTSYAQQWQQYGIHIRPLDRPFLVEAITAADVETALRKKRQYAQDNPDLHQGFVVRLIDELGDREIRPFDLLEDEEEDPELIGIRAQLQEGMEIIREEASQDGDWDTVAWADEMLDGGLDEMYEAALAGDQQAFMREIMAGAGLDQAELAEWERDLAGVLGDIDGMEATHAAIHDLVGSMRHVLQGGDSDIFLQSLETVRISQEDMQRQIDEKVQELIADIEKRRSSIGDPGRNTARAVLTIEQDFAHGLSGFAAAQSRREAMTAMIEEREDDYRKSMEEWQEMMQEPAGFPVLPEEDDSSLYFDPIQAFLVHVDLFLAARDPTTSGLSLPWPGSRTAQASVLDPCAHIGNLESNHPDLYGGLTTMLDIAAATQGAVSEFRELNMKRALMRVARGVFNTVTTEISARIEYKPPENDGILMRFWHDDPKKAEIHVEVRDMVPDLLPEPIRNALQGAASATEVCGPLLDAANLIGGGAGELAGELEAIQRLAEGRDLSNIPVIFKMEAQHWHVIDPRPADWELIRAGTHFMQRTDDDGRTVGPFRPGLDGLDVGGWRTEVRVPIDIQARIHESASVIWNPANWGLAVGEDLFSPIETTVALSIYELEPLPMTGQITIRRTVRAEGAAEYADEDGESDIKEKGSATATLRLTNVEINKDGIAGTSKASLSIVGDWEGEYYEESACDDGGTSTLRQTATGSIDDSEQGTLPGVRLQVDSRSALHDFNIGKIMSLAGSMAHSIQGTQTIKERGTYCSGESYARDPQTASASLPDGLFDHLFHSLPARIPARERPEFERTAQQVTGQASWDERYPSKAVEMLRARMGRPPHQVVYNVHTTVDWSFTRHR